MCYPGFHCLGTGDAEELKVEGEVRVPDVPHLALGVQEAKGGSAMVADGFGEVGGVGLVCLGLGDVLPGVLVGRRAVGGGRVSVRCLGHEEKVLPRTTKDTREALDVLYFRISLVSGHSSGYPHPAPTVSNKNPKISMEIGRLLGPR